jgi:hypothetical protein
MKHIVLVMIAVAVAGAGCDRTDRSSVVPIAGPTIVQPSPASSPRAESVPNFRAEAVSISAAGEYGGCGWGRTPGEKVQKGWRITIDGGAVLLDEDVGNWPTDDVPYHGTLEGRRFTARVDGSPDYLSYACQWRGGNLSGEFTADFSAFDADETMFWGPPERETVVHRHWVGSRIAD